MTRPVTIVKRINLRGPGPYTWHVMQDTWEIWVCDTLEEAEAKRDAYMASRGQR